MGDEVSVEVRTAEFEAAMQRMVKGVREGFIDPSFGTLSVQARLLAEQCQDYTPPRNVGQGNAAVMRDLTRIYFPVTAKTFKSKRLQKIVRRDNRDAWNAAAMNFSDSHGLRNTKAMTFEESFHAEKRISRGRSSGLANGKRGAKKNFGFVTLGPEAAKARAYMKKVKQRVGWARAGWNQGILSLGGTVSQGWVSRHSVNRGRIVDQRSAANPSIQVINDTGWAQYNNSEGNRIIRNAVAQRAAKMQTYYEKMMQLAANKAQGAA